MHLRLRYAFATGLIICVASLSYFCYLYSSDAPVHIVTNLIYEPGHDIENAKLCNGRDPLVFIGVMSAPKNYAERNAIRATWGNHRRRGEVAMAFFVGKSLDADVNRQITKESMIHSDIVRSNNVDTYTNLTLKTISLIEWTNRHCSKARFILKCDDDVFVNVNNLLSFVNSKVNSKMTIFGELGKGLGPLWWPPRWYVSSAEYGKPMYPDFVFGPAYLLSADCLQILYQHALNTEFFRLEDVFITGIVAESAQIERVGSWLFVRRDYSPEIDHGRNFMLLNESKIRISIHGVSPSEEIEISNLILNKS